MSGVGLAVMVYTSSPVEEVLWMMENWSALQDRLSYLADGGHAKLETLTDFHICSFVAGR